VTTPETPETSETPNPPEKKPPNNLVPSLSVQFIMGVFAAIAVVAVAAGINHAWPIFGTSGGGGGGGNQAAATAQPSYLTLDSFLDQKPVSMDVGTLPVQGKSGSKVTIVEFSDFECPYCARFVSQTLPQILQDYGDKIQFAFRNYPLPASMHPYAEKAAEAAECASDQDAFWQYHDLLFQNQSDLASVIQSDQTNGVNLVISKLKEYASNLGLDTAKFNQCLDSGADADKVSADQKAMTDAMSEAGISSFGTPSFFINGRFVSGAYPYDTSTSGYQEGMFTFKQAIDAALGN
jgi:protein-disulfide isomerase